MLLKLVSLMLYIFELYLHLPIVFDFSFGRRWRNKIVCTWPNRFL